MGGLGVAPGEGRDGEADKIGTRGAYVMMAWLMKLRGRPDLALDWGSFGGSSHPNSRAVPSPETQ